MRAGEGRKQKYSPGREERSVKCHDCLCLCLALTQVDQSEREDTEGPTNDKAFFHYGAKEMAQMIVSVL